MSHSLYTELSVQNKSVLSQTHSYLICPGCMYGQNALFSDTVVLNVDRVGTELAELHQRHVRWVHLQHRVQLPWPRKLSQGQGGQG